MCACSWRGWVFPLAAYVGVELSGPADAKEQARAAWRRGERGALVGLQVSLLRHHGGRGECAADVVAKFSASNTQSFLQVYGGSACTVAPEDRMPALPFDVVVYDLVQLLVRRDDCSVDSLVLPDTRISEDQVCCHA